MTVLSLVYAVATAIYTTMAVIVIQRNPKAILNWLCGLVLVCFTIWTPYGIFHHLQPPIPFAQADLVYKIGKAGTNFVTSVWLLFSLALTNRKKHLRAWPIYIPILGIPLALSIREWYGPVVGTLVLGPGGWGSKWELSFWSILYVVDYVYLVARFGRHATQKRQRRQALVTFCSAGATFVGASLVDVVFPILTGRPVPEMAQIVGLSWAVGLYITVTRYGLTSFTVQAAADKVLATMPDVLLLLDTDGNVVTSNEALVDVLGHDRRALCGSSATTLLDQAGDFEPMLERLHREHHLPGLEVLARHRDGRQVPVSITARTMRLGDGSVRGSVWVLRDITLRRAAEERQAEMTRELAATNQELATANKELAAFASVVSHDLKAPLRAIDSLVRWLASDYGEKFDTEGREQVKLLLGRVTRMHNLIDGIQQYSRAGRVIEKRVDVDLSTMMPEVIDFLSPPSHIKVKIETPLPTVSAEKTLIEQVFRNLLSNAVRYNDKPEGLVRVGGLDGGDHWRFYVADNGPGIEERNFERIFHIFETCKPRDQSDSTGVGLAVVKKAVELHGGRVWVESKVGEGSTFFFTFPKKP
jgi:two-component system sensor kinase FixL